jgi:hypothetical protein
VGGLRAFLTSTLYGVDADAPYARVGRLGAAFLACMRAHRVVAVDTMAIRVVTRTAARLSAYRPGPGGVLVWSLYPSGAAVEPGDHSRSITQRPSRAEAST